MSNEPKLTPPGGTPVSLVMDASVRGSGHLPELLGASGLRVKTWESLDQCLAAAADSPCGLLIVCLPAGGSAGDVCRSVRANPGAGNVPLMLLDGSSAAGAEIAALEAGADDYAAITEAPALLLARITAVLRRRRPGAGMQDAREGKPSVLVVDDSETYAEYVALMLQRAGFQVDMADTGRDALARIPGAGFDAVVLDMILPDMHGPRMCAEFATLRAAPGGGFVLLMLTGGEDPPEMAAVLQAGADDVVGKSQEMNVIIARLRALLRAQPG